MTTHAANPPDGAPALQSGVLYSPADALLSQAIADTLAAAAPERAAVFAQRADAIAGWIAAHFPQRPWTCQRYTGTDGAAIFRGGVGHSLVIDCEGTLWRARSYEDFDTGYRFIGNTCEIATLTPRYEQMRRYVARDHALEPLPRG